jgi:hypothetical protein
MIPPLLILPTPQFSVHVGSPEVNLLFLRHRTRSQPVSLSSHNLRNKNFTSTYPESMNEPRRTLRTCQPRGVPEMFSQFETEGRTVQWVGETVEMWNKFVALFYRQWVCYSKTEVPCELHPVYTRAIQPHPCIQKYWTQSVLRRDVGGDT